MPVGEQYIRQAESTNSGESGPLQMLVGLIVITGLLYSPHLLGCIPLITSSRSPVPPPEKPHSSRPLPQQRRESSREVGVEVKKGKVGIVGDVHPGSGLVDLYVGGKNQVLQYRVGGPNGLRVAGRGECGDGLMRDIPGDPSSNSTINSYRGQTGEVSMYRDGDNTVFAVLEPCNHPLRDQRGQISSFYGRGR